MKKKKVVSSVDIPEKENQDGEKEWCVYTDSIPGFEPVVVKNVITGQVDVKSVSELEYCWDKCKVWSDIGFTRIKNFIKKPNRKKLYTVRTREGCVHVTEDHSLLTDQKVSIKPIDVEIGETKLLHKSFDKSQLNGKSEISKDYAWLLGFFVAEGSCGTYETRHGVKYAWAISNQDKTALRKSGRILQKEFDIVTKIDDVMESSNCNKLRLNGNGYRSVRNITEKFRPICYTESGLKKVPKDILNCKDGGVIKSFLDGYSEGDGRVNERYTKRWHEFHTNSPILAQGVTFLLNKIGNEVGVNYRRNYGKEYIQISNQDFFRNGSRRVDSIEELDYEGEYVYDLQTESQHFGCGVGSIIVHNTDSITADTEIRTKEFGKINVSELFDELYQLKNSKIIEKNGRSFAFPENVNSYYYDGREIDWGKIDYVERHKVDKDIYKISLGSDYSVKITSDHSIMVLGENNWRLKEKKPKDIDASDEFLVLRSAGEGRVIDDVLNLESIKKVDSSPQYVYDIGMMDNPHVFFANDILVHNSVFYPARPIVRSTRSDVDTEDDDDMTEAILEVADEVQKYLNHCYDHFAEKLLHIPQDDHWFEIKQEMVAKSGLWIRKKRYAQWIINDEGDPTDELDVKGLDIVRSDFPTAFRNLLEDVIVSILKGASKKDVDDKILDFRENLKSFGLEKVARPTGVGDLSDYETDDFGRTKKGAPAHFVGALNYNDLISYYDLENEIAPIRGGQKIKWVYLKKNNLGFDKMAFKGTDDPDQIMKFLKDHTDYIKLYKKGLKNKLESVYDALGWKFPSENQRQAQKFFNM